MRRVPGQLYSRELSVQGSKQRLVIISYKLILMISCWLNEAFYNNNKNIKRKYKLKLWHLKIQRQEINICCNELLFPGFTIQAMATADWQFLEASRWRLPCSPYNSAAQRMIQQHSICPTSSFLDELNLLDQRLIPCR